MNYLIKDIPKYERPRERFIRYGPKSLSDIELLAIVLKTGTKELSSKDIATSLLKEIGDIKKLSNMTISNLTKLKGIGITKAIELLTVVEIGKRIFLKEDYSNKEILNNPQKIYKSFKYLFQGVKQERFYCLYFNNKCELIERKLLFMGTINKSIVHPREIFKEAYLLGASSIICIHNHPSGDTKPSNEDILFTNNLIKIGEIQDIKVVDHIIIGEKNYYSFLEQGLI